MTRLRPFVKDSAFKKKTSNKSIWSLLCASILVITIVLFRSYARYVHTNEEILIDNTNVGEYYIEELLNGADPVLTSDLMPVIINDNGYATKANIKEEWYRYENKTWANAVKTKNSYDTLNAYGKVSGATKNRGYVSFDGVDDYIDLGLTGYNFGDTFSIAARFKVNDLTGATQIFNCFELSGFGFNVTSGYKIQATLHNGAYVNVNSTTKLEDNKFYTVLFTYDGTSMNLYINGVLEASKECTGNVSVKVPLLLGANSYYNNAHTEFGKSDIAQAIVLDRVVDSEEAALSFKDNINLYNNESILVYEDFSKDPYVEDEIIPEDSIESYFVWIPKYSYQLWDLGEYNSLTSLDTTKPHAIGIKFGTTNTSDGVLGECATPGIAGSSGNCVVGNYMTHPAFLAFDTNGFWVGKFETGYDGATTTTEAQVNESDVSKVIIKPNVYSWRGSALGNFFKNGYEYDRDNESHMMKNTEWGAVAYLSHSDYGIQASVRFNNNSTFITGYAALEEPTVIDKVDSVDGDRYESTERGNDGIYTVNYFNSSSVIASTTGNYSGVYDMSGGASEFVMAYTNNVTLDNELSDITNFYDDFFDNDIWSMYYDEYSSKTYTDFDNRVLGDAIGEMGPFYRYTTDSGGTTRSSWYDDYAYFPIADRAWFVRGGNWQDGVVSGLFYIYGINGNISSAGAFRMILSPSN